MSITVIIDQYIIDQRVVLLITDDDLLSVNDYWNNISIISKILLKNEVVDKLLTWGELDPVHYQTLIKTQLEQYVSLDIDSQCDINNIVVNTFRFLLCAYIRKITEFLKSDIDTIRIQQLSHKDFSMSITLSVGLIEKRNKKSKKPDLTLIVDNT